MNRKIVPFSHRKDKIKCECGDEILISLDAKAIGKAIDIHVDSHLAGEKGPICSEIDADRLRDYLIGQVFKMAAEPNEE